MTHTPSIGRTVHYVSHGSKNGWYESAHRAAIVTEVYPDTDGLIGICVLNPTGIFFCEAEYDESCGPGTWHWPERVDS